MLGKMQAVDRLRKMTGPSSRSDLIRQEKVRAPEYIHAQSSSTSIFRSHWCSDTLKTFQSFTIPRQCES